MHQIWSKSIKKDPVPDPPQFHPWIWPVCIPCRLFSNNGCRERERESTAVLRLFDEVKERSIDVKDHDIKSRELLLQRYGRGVKLPIEMNGVYVQPLHALVSVRSEQSDCSRQAPKRWQRRHPHLPPPQLVQFLPHHSTLAINSTAHWIA